MGQIHAKCELKADKTFHHRAYLAQQQHQKLKGEYNISP
jgi:hypothetical protein